MIVDSDTALLGALRFDLELDGFAVETHRSVASLRPDRLPVVEACLVIEDNLPGQRGLDLLRRLRSASIGLPAIVMTSQPTAAFAQRAEALGAAMLEKPLLGDALNLAIRRALATDWRAGR